MKRLMSMGAVVVGASLMMAPGSCSQARKASLQKMNEGVALAQMRNPDAIGKFEEAINLDHTNDRAAYNMAMAYFDLEQYGRAAQAMRQAISINGQNAMYQDRLATILLQLDPPQREPAKAALEACVRLDPTIYKAHFRLAQVLEAMGDDQAALAAYTESIKRGPRFTEAYIELGRLYAEVGFPQQALQVMRSGVPLALEGSVEKARLHYMMGTVLQEQGNIDQAIRELRTSIEIEPIAAALYSIGIALEASGNREEAIRYLNKYLEVAGPTEPEQYKSVAREKLARLGG